MIKLICAAAMAAVLTACGSMQGMSEYQSQDKIVPHVVRTAPPGTHAVY